MKKKLFSVEDAKNLKIENVHDLYENMFQKHKLIFLKVLHLEMI